MNVLSAEANAVTLFVRYSSVYALGKQYRIIISNLIKNSAIPKIIILNILYEILKTAFRSISENSVISLADFKMGI